MRKSFSVPGPWALHFPFCLWATVLLTALCVPASAQTDTTRGALPDSATVEQDMRAGLVTVAASDLDAEIAGQEVSGILRSSRDVFANTAGFNFGAARFRIRGLDGEENAVSVNGILVNDLESGYAPWSLWGGLNDVTRWTETRTGISSSPYGFGGMAGWTNLDLRASKLRKGTRLSYASTNRTYRNRAMATYNTGMLPNGWAFSLSGSLRWADEGYVPGTFYNAGAYFLSAEKKINEKHSIGFTGFGAPIVSGRQGLAVAEAQTLTGDHYYNPNWGWQNGEKRNANVSNDHKPVFILSHWYKPDDRTRWNTSVLYTFGRDGYTALNWYDAPDPRPDYYRYLPSYYEDTYPGIATGMADAWANDAGTSQINWDQLYFANGKNLYTVHDVDGVAGSTLTGMRSKYIVEDRRADPTRIAANSVWSRDLNDQLTLTLGASYTSQKTHYFKVIDDLLGGDFWLDLDQFAARDSDDPNAAQNDLNLPNHVAYVGDEFGYDYDIRTNRAELFGQVEKKWSRVEGYAGLQLANTTFWRDGHYRKALFPENSFGPSEKQSFLHGGVKAGAVYKISGRQYITANAAFLTNAPTARAAFLSPRTRDAVVDGLTTEKSLGGDLSYEVRMPRVKGRATLYLINSADGIWSRSFYHDVYRTFVNYSMTGVDRQHIGLELGAEVKLSPTWQLTAVYAEGQSVYSSRPLATITRDNSDTALAVDRTVYWKNYRIGGMPQRAASLGLRYNAPRYWSVGADVNYFGNIYLDPNPDRRTAEALGNLVQEDPQWNALLDQTQLDDGITLNLFFTKSWQLMKKYRIGLNLSVSNALDNTDLVTGGYEQLRYDPMEIDKFPAKLSYMYGRNYYAMLTFSF
ncbi:MAG: TonB-dependent receptor plug domain-containing protein [Flavobacteriales bacterium]|nr:TonB-dependent receptor plug domain-containing protein [Flavobacteriales bacterium]